MLHTYVYAKLKLKKNVHFQLNTDNLITMEKKL